MERQWFCCEGAEIDNRRNLDGKWAENGQRMDRTVDSNSYLGIERNLAEDCSIQV